MNDWYPLHRERYALHLPVVYGLRVALHRNYTMRDHSAQPREDVSIAGVVACGKRSTRGPSRSCVFCVDTWQSVVPVPGVLWSGRVGGVGPHRCVALGSCTASSSATPPHPHLGWELWRWTCSPSGRALPQGPSARSRCPALPGLLEACQAGTSAACESGSSELCQVGGPPVCGPPGAGGRGGGRAGAGAGPRPPARCRRDRRIKATLETVWTQRMRGGR